MSKREMKKKQSVDREGLSERCREKVARDLAILNVQVNNVLQVRVRNAKISEKQLHEQVRDEEEAERRPGRAERKMHGVGGKGLCNT